MVISGASIIVTSVTGEPERRLHLLVVRIRAAPQSFPKSRHVGQSLSCQNHGHPSAAGKCVTDICVDLTTLPSPPDSTSIWANAGCIYLLWKWLGKMRVKSSVIYPIEMKRTGCSWSWSLSPLALRGPGCSYLATPKSCVTAAPQANPVTIPPGSRGLCGAWLQCKGAPISFPPPTYCIIILIGQRLLF